MNTYNTFLFDLDDTLLDFKASEELSFYETMKTLGVNSELKTIIEYYKIVNQALWRQFEQGLISKDDLKVERFRRTFNQFDISLNPDIASKRYLDALPESVVLIDYAKEICEWLKDKGQIGIITNGIAQVQHKRIENSQIAPYIDFVSVSETCGHAKPDVRFFEHSSKFIKDFEKMRTLVIGDRPETDILGAKNFGVDSCLFNPENRPIPNDIKATHNISHLQKLKGIIIT